MKELQAKIGRLAVENDYFVARAYKVSPAKKKAMIRGDHPELSISQQCKLVELSRSAFCYAPGWTDAATLALMQQVDRLFAKYSFFGSRQIAAYLRREDIAVGVTASGD